MTFHKDWFYGSIPMSEDPPNSSEYHSPLPKMIEDNKPHPHDSMPIATYGNRYAPPEKMRELEENPRPEEEAADDWFQSDTYASRHKSTPDHEKSAEEIVTMHEQMYRIATARYNPFSIGGSENCDADIDCPIGGSENIQK